MVRTTVPGPPVHECSVSRFRVVLNAGGMTGVVQREVAAGSLRTGLSRAETPSEHTPPGQAALPHHAAEHIPQFQPILRSRRQFLQRFS